MVILYLLKKQCIKITAMLFAKMEFRTLKHKSRTLLLLCLTPECQINTAKGRNEFRVQLCLGLHLTSPVLHF